MFALTIVIIAVLLILAVGLYVVGTEMWEYEKGFTYFVYAMLILIAGFAVYLAYAAPSVAELNPRGASEVAQDEINLLPE